MKLNITIPYQIFYVTADTFSYLGIPLITSYTPKKLLRSTSRSTRLNFNGKVFPLKLNRS